MSSRYREPVSASLLRERVARSEPPDGGLQLHELADPPVNYFCPRCGWHGYVWKVATVDGDWTAPAQAVPSGGLAGRPRAGTHTGR
jgi:hypothetical protein